MFPQWLSDVFRRFYCHKCKHKLDTHSLRGVGVGIFRRGTDLPPQTAGRLEIRCEHCGAGSFLQIDVALDDLLQTVTLLHRHGSELLHDHHGQVEASDDRGVAALGPWEEAEIRTFLQALKRISFRRDTQSFKRWMGQIEGEDKP